MIGSGWRRRNYPSRRHDGVAIGHRIQVITPTGQNWRLSIQQEATPLPALVKTDRQSPAPHGRFTLRERLRPGANEQGFADMDGNLSHQDGVVTRARRDVLRTWAHLFLLFSRHS